MIDLLNDLLKVVDEDEIGVDNIRTSDSAIQNKIYADEIDYLQENYYFSTHYNLTQDCEEKVDLY